MSDSDEEDDYMNMVFDDAPKQPTHETSLQRAARKRKEVRPRNPANVINARTDTTPRVRLEHAKRRRPNARQTQRQLVKQL